MKKNRLEQRQLMKIEEVSPERMSLEQKQLAERLYHQLGLDPVVDKVLKEYSESLTGMDRATDKVFGPYDVKGRAGAVAKTSALIAYAALTEQYNQEVGNLQSQMTALAGEQDKERNNYEGLVAKVAEIVGGDYDELKANYNQIVEKLADIEHLRSQTSILSKEKAELAERYESETAQRDAKIKGLESEKGTLATELEQLKTAVAMLAGAIPCEQIGKESGKELYAFLLKDSKVPDAVIDGVGKFIDFKKYLGMAAERGAKEASKHAEEILGRTAGTTE